VSGFIQRGGWTGEFLSDAAEEKYKEYVAVNNWRSFKIYSIAMMFVSTVVLVVRALALTEVNIKGRATRLGGIFQIASLLLLWGCSSKAEYLLLRRKILLAVYLVQSSFSIGAQTALLGSVSPTCLAFFFIYHSTAGLLFSSLKNCVILCAIQTPAMVACTLLLQEDLANDSGTDSGTVIVYCTILGKARAHNRGGIMALKLACGLPSSNNKLTLFVVRSTLSYFPLTVMIDAVILLNTSRLEDKHRTSYALVVFIADENNRTQITLNREELFDNSDSDSEEEEEEEEEDEEEEKGKGEGNKDDKSSPNNGSPPKGRLSIKGRRTIRKTHFSRDVFIHSIDVEILQEVGRGSFGIVYRGAWHDTVVCVKHLIGAGNVQNEDEFFKQFAKEAQLMSNLRHPNIVMFMGVIIESDFVGLVTEFCFEGNVSDLLIDEETAISESVVMRMIIDVCRGMSFLHLHKPPIIHKDLKGQNILVTDNWHCKVADFGMSKVLVGNGIRR
jgi:hypothetical protein